MEIKKTGVSLAVLTALALSLTACASNETPAATTNNSPGLSGTLAGKGASSMKSAQEKWVADFQTANPGVTVNYSPDGSGAGRDAFKAGAVAFAGSDRPLKDDEMGAGNFAGCTAGSNALNLPVYVSPIAVIFNVEGVTDLKLDAGTLAGIFSGAINRWNDPAIVALNAGANLPDAAITAVHRSDDSGTTNNFTDYLHQVAGSVWTPSASDTWPTAFAGEAAKGTAGVVDAVRNGKNTIGYADESAATGLSIATVKVGSDFLAPTAESAAKIVDASTQIAGRAEHDWALVLDRKAEGAYPIVLVSYAIACEQYSDSATATLVKAYLGYITSPEGQKSAQAQAGNAPLSDTMSARVQASVASIS